MTAEPTARSTQHHHAGVAAERVDEGYLHKRQLRELLADAAEDVR